MKRGYLIVVFILIVASFFAGYQYSRRNGAKTESAGVREILCYVDPMNPGFKSDKPGIAPCGMPLEPVYAGDADSKDRGSLPQATVKVSSDRQQLIGVKTAMVEKTPWNHTIRVLGRVVPDERRIYRINAATDGWIKKMLPPATDSLVEKDELLATFYAPEFFSAMKAYLYGLRSLDRFEKGQEPKEQLDLTSANIDNYRNSLRNLGMSEHQMDEIMRTRQGGDQVEIRAPATGFILLKNITLGQRFEKGSELYRIADLSKVWIVTDTFETEASLFKPGMEVTVSARNLKTAFFARVANVPPRFDPTSRTLQVRLEADNPGLLLRPDMFVDAELPMSLPAAITLPVDAIIETGLKKTVYVDLGDGYFEPRRVETGWRLGKRVEITGGLMPGEKVVVSGNFLIDSESRMRAVAAGIRGDESKDPVCGKFVGQEKARASGAFSQHEGQTYYFCSDQCKRDFELHPEYYLDTKVSEPTPSDQHAVPAPGKDQQVQQVEEQLDTKDTQVSSDPPTMPPPGMDMRGMRRRRGGPVSSQQPSMPAREKDEQIKRGGEQQDTKDALHQPSIPGHNHD
jgi:membrane fusion protein, copper/silver efflux system